MSTHTPYGFKGVVDSSADMTYYLDAFTRELPAGTRVAHRRTQAVGRVRVDNASNVPGYFDGRARAHCFASEDATTQLVCVSWDNTDGVGFIVWVQRDLIEKADADVRNLPRPRTAGAR